MHRFTDNATLNGVKETRDGYLVADALIVRTGVQTYLGSEVGKPEVATVKLYRPESEVFAKDSVQSFSHVPVTINHPQEFVTKDNWRELAKGEASSEVLRDGERLRIPIVLKDASAIQLVKGGMRELSAGYSSLIDWTPGVTPQGEQFDGVQRQIKANHIAIVSRGRAGSEFRIGDAWGSAPVKEEQPMSTRNILVDGIPVEATEASAIVIAKLITDRDTVKADLVKLGDAIKTKLDDKDAEIGKLKAELQTVKDATPNGPALDKLVAERAELVSLAKTIVKDFDPTNLGDMQIRRAVVKAKLGDVLVADSTPDAEVLGMFRVIVKDAADNRDPAMAGLRDRHVPTPTLVGDADAEWKKMCDELVNAHRPKVAA